MLGNIAISILLAYAPPAEEANDSAWAGPSNRGEWEIAMVPKITLNADNGIGLGLRGKAFWHRWDQDPYKTALTAQIFATSRLVQHHLLAVDAIDAFGLPLRLEAELGYFQSRSQNFCGLGGVVSCELDPRGDENFLKVRYLRPYLRTRARYRFNKRPHKPEVYLGFRSHFYQPGDLVDDDGDGELDFFAYPGSLYDRAFPGGERGFANVFELGAILDDRDIEADPRHGYFLLAGLRGTHTTLGSAWSFVAATLEARVYAPLRGEHLTVASRVLIDQMIGDAPIQELARTGALDDALVFGGADVGRGIRVQRYLGRFKAMTQHELRARLTPIELFGQSFEPGIAFFVDGGVVAMDPLSEPLRLAYGAGVSFRIAYNKNFTMRLDIAISPDEAFAPAVYSSPGFAY